MFYVGRAKDVGRRIRQPVSGRGAKFTRDHALPRLVYFEGPMSQAEAVQREAQLKRWSRAKKEALIRRDTGLLKSLTQSRGFQ